VRSRNQADRFDQDRPLPPPRSCACSLTRSPTVALHT
jgi:hypothetical protein